MFHLPSSVPNDLVTKLHFAQSTPRPAQPSGHAPNTKFSTSVELDPRNVRPSVCLSVRQNLPWFLFCRFILMLNLCIWSHFGLKSDFWPFLGSPMAEICVFWAFFDIVGLHSPVAGLFKFGSLRFFGDSIEISPYVLEIFSKFSLWGPHQPSKNGSKPKIFDFCEIVGLKTPVGGLFKFGSVRFFGDSREISPYVLGIFPKFSVWGPHEPSKNG